MLASSCASTDRAEAQSTVRVFKYAGSVQCSGGGLDLSTMQRQLTDRGLKVLGSTCGTDGRMRVAMCDASDGRIGLFELSTADAEAASSLGYAPVSKLPGFKETPCK